MRKWHQLNLLQSLPLSFHYRKHFKNKLELTYLHACQRNHKNSQKAFQNKEN